MANPTVREKFVNWITGSPISLFDAASSIFNASGASHTIGLVPDPGANAGTTNFLREDATWATPPIPSTAGALVNIQAFTSVGAATYTPTAGATTAIVVLTGGGGGSGGVGATVDSNTAGGSAAATGILFVSPAVIASLTVGAAGLAGTSVPGSGGNGGQTIYASATANGGLGTPSSNTGTPGATVAGTVTTSGCTFSIAGGDGGASVGAASANVAGGNGGASFWGGGGFGASAGNASSVGNPGVAPGSGGGGTISPTAAKAGAAGAPGIVVVFEFK